MKEKRLTVEGLKSKEKPFNFRPSTFRLPFLLLASCFLLLPSCTFLYIPPVLESQPLPPVLNLDGSTGLNVRGDNLELSLQLVTVPKEGWLAVQWYSPQNELLASDAQWVTPEQEGFSVVFGLPGDNQPGAGDWRVIVTYQEAFVRQFGLTVTDADE